ncbi:MAG: S1 RNA-binding domain-containing protein [Planctomycetes bacterium]|nr:S1 RNA-binding domain-containing protein [Planctomycetota bacterium]
MSSDRSKKSDPLSAEIEDALGGMNLQEIDLPQRGAPVARDQKRGMIVGITGDDVFVEIGPRMQGVISLREFETPPKVGEVHDFTLHGREDDLWKLSRKAAQVLAAWDDVQPGSIVKAKVTGQNTGGLELKVGPLSAFMPASQVSLSREDNLAQYMTQMLTCKVLEVDPGKKRILLSRRAVLETEREAERKEVAGKYTSGQVVKGKVTRVEPFGAFVDLGNGVEGLVHVSNVTRRRIETASEVLSPGQSVDVMILEIKDGGKRIGLGMKQLEPDPWADAARKYAPDSTIEGKVTRLMEFGAFVELEPGLEGLVHVSQLANDRVRRPSDVVKPGQKLVVRVINVDTQQGRISLSRMDPRGALIGSEDSVDTSVIDTAMKANDTKPIGTNLGNLFKKALKDPKQA